MILDWLSFHIVRNWPLALDRYMPMRLVIRAHDWAYRDVWANGEPR